MAASDRAVTDAVVADAVVADAVVADAAVADVVVADAAAVADAAESDMDRLFDRLNSLQAGIDRLARMETGAAMLEVSPWGCVVDLILSFLFPYFGGSARGDAKALGVVRVLALIYWRQQGRHIPRPYYCMKSPYELLRSCKRDQRAYAIARYYQLPTLESVRAQRPTVRMKLLIVAAASGYLPILEAAEVLLPVDAVVVTLFWAAVAGGSAGAVVYLHTTYQTALETGLDNAYGNDGDVVTMYWEPLVCAATAGHLPVVERLIDFGAGRGRRGLHAMTEAFWTAAIEGHLDVVRHLVGRGVRPTAGDRAVARARGQDELLEYLDSLTLEQVLPPHAQM